MKYNNQLLTVKVTSQLKQLCNLLFELSNEDRLNILLELQKNPLRLSHISEKFHFTVPETARNIARLTEANLLYKDADGRFRLTPLGEEALKLLPSFEFISKNKNYLQTHSLSRLPPEFATGIGALVDYKFVKEVTTSIFNIENMMRQADEFIWVMVDQLLASAVSLSAEAVSRGVELRKIIPRTADIPDPILTLANDPVFEKAARARKLESRYLDRVDVTILLSEKELALIAFPTLEGKFDFLGFQSQDELAHNWAKSLFLHYWDKAKR